MKFRPVSVRINGQMMINVGGPKGGYQTFVDGKIVCYQPSPLCTIC